MLCKRIPYQQLFNFLRDCGVAKCEEYGVVIADASVQAATPAREHDGKDPLQVLADAMGFKDPAAFPERNSLFDAAKAAAQHAAAGKTAAAAGSTAQAPQPPLQLDDDSRDALKFRRLLDDNLPLHPCCVCGIRMRRCDLQ
ncbi:hypothetical protein PLESTF_001000800, partial [Pleodorina starrii]